MHPRSTEWLNEALYSARYIQSRAANRTHGDYLGDEDLRSIVERKFEIIGGNLARIRDHDSGTLWQIAGAHQIIGLRNLLAHAYQDIDNDRIWSFIQTSLPVLIADVERLLDRHTDDDRP